MFGLFPEISLNFHQVSKNEINEKKIGDLFHEMDDTIDKESFHNKERKKKLCNIAKIWTLSMESKKFFQGSEIN